MKKLSAILPLRTRTHTLSLVVSAATWLAGVAAVYLVAPLGTGLGLIDSYAAFQGGSNFGNAVALGIYTLWGAGVLFVLRGSRLSPVTSVLAAHGFIGIGTFYPGVVMSLGIAHVLGYEDDAPAQGVLAMKLVISGGIALLLLLGTLVGRGMGNRMARFGASQRTPSIW